MAQLLAEIDGMQAGSGSGSSQGDGGAASAAQDIFVIGATNRWADAHLRASAKHQSLRLPPLLKRRSGV